jgi:hypothetical protein
LFIALNLYRRHRQECEAGHPEETRSGEFEERKKGWKRCACFIFASGTLAGKFILERDYRDNLTAQKEWAGSRERMYQAPRQKWEREAWRSRGNAPDFRMARPSRTLKPLEGLWGEQQKLQMVCLISSTRLLQRSKNASAKFWQNSAKSKRKSLNESATGTEATGNDDKPEGQPRPSART